MVNESHPNVLYASLNVFIVPLPLLPLMIFGFLTYQPIALSSTQNTQIFLSLSSTLLLLHLVGKISIIFFPNNLIILFLFKIFITYSTTRFFPLELIANHLPPPASYPNSVSLTFHPSPSQISSPSSNLYNHFPSLSTLFLAKFLNELSSFYPINIINLSLATSKVPTSFESSIVTPILKKPSLDPSLSPTTVSFLTFPFSPKFLKKLFTSNFQTFFFLTNFFPLLNLAFDSPLLKLAF